MKDLLIKLDEEEKKIEALKKKKYPYFWFIVLHLYSCNPSLF